MLEVSCYDASYDYLQCFHGLQSPSFRSPLATLAWQLHSASGLQKNPFKTISDTFVISGLSVGTSHYPITSAPYKESFKINVFSSIKFIVLLIGSFNVPIPWWICHISWMLSYPLGVAFLLGMHKDWHKIQCSWKIVNGRCVYRVICTHIHCWCSGNTLTMSAKSKLSCTKHSLVVTRDFPLRGLVNLKMDHVCSP